MLLALLSIRPFIANSIFTRLNEGGPLFMYTTLLILIVIILLLIRGFLKPAARDKTITLVSSISLFVLVWGFLGQMLGLIGAFDAIEAAGDISPSLVAGGIKVALLTTVFGLIVAMILQIFSK